MNRFLRYGLPVLGLAAAVAAFIGLMTLEELYVLPSTVHLQSQDFTKDWLPFFRMTQQEWILFPALAFAVVWFLLSLVKPAFRGDNRGAWLVLWAITVIPALICVMGGTLEKDIGFIPEFVYIINAAILFWVATAPFSTITHKFAPVGSGAARKLW